MIEQFTLLDDTCRHLSCVANQADHPSYRLVHLEMNMTKPDGGWDRPAIIAEVHRRGMTLTGIAKDAGLYMSACRQGIGGNSRPGAQAIADALGIPFEELFPTSYMRGRHHNQDDTNRNSSCNTSAKRRARADSAHGAL